MLAPDEKAWEGNCLVKNMTLSSCPSKAPKIETALFAGHFFLLLCLCSFVAQGTDARVGYLSHSPEGLLKFS